MPGECVSCNSRLKIAPMKPRLAAATRMLSYALVFVAYWICGRSLAVVGFGLLIYLLAVILIDRTLGRPILVIAIAEPDFLREELSEDGDASRTEQNQGEQGVVGNRDNAASSLRSGQSGARLPTL